MDRAFSWTRSYPQARLRLGMLAVGSMVVTASLGLGSGWAFRLSWLEAAGLFLLLSLPFDLLGGWLLPRSWKTAAQPTRLWGPRYLRGVVLHLGWWSLGLTAVTLAAGLGGPTAGAAAYLLLALAFLSGQLTWCALVGVGLRPGPDGRLAYPGDPRFTGGIAGPPWPGHELLVTPAWWADRGPHQGLERHLERRRRLLRTGARRAGAWLGLLYNALGIWLMLHWGLTHPVALACGTTLFSFLGLLLLPSLSRPGVLAADAAVPLPSDWLRWSESFQEEAEQRSPWVERIFHPIPSLHRRLNASSSARWVPWNLARYALLTSVVGGSLLSRAVHCNCGRPELWFWPPND